jgi:hypothetical protein
VFGYAPSLLDYGLPLPFNRDANEILYQEREAEFRDQSETTNGRVVRWTLMQLAVLSAACAWQLSHLRSFFIKQKLT